MSRIFAGALLIVFITIFSSLALILVLDTPSGTVGTERVTVGYSPLSVYLPLFVAQDRGYFQEEGLEVVTVESAKSSDKMSALLAGRIDIALYPTLPTILGAESNSPGTLKMFLPAHSTKDGGNMEHLIIRNDSEIEGIADLEGKKIGIYPSGSQVLWTEMILSAFFDPANAEVVQLAPSAHISSLESGFVDALVSLEPTASVAIREGMAREVGNSIRARYIKDPFYTSACAVTNELLEREPERVARFVSALERGVDFIRENPEEARASLTAHTSVDEELAPYVTVPFYDKEGEIDYDAMQALVDTIYAGGIIEKSVNISDIVLE